MDLDALIVEIGQFGKYQAKVLVLLIFPFMHHSICSLSYVFSAGDLKYRCTIPVCDGRNSDFNSSWVKYAIPQNVINNQCKRFKFIGESASYGNCTKELFSFNETETCSDFVFGDPENTIVKEFNLLCEENNWKRTTVGTLNSVAQFVGLPLSGFLSDRYGRKTVIIISVLASALLGSLRSFSSSYIEFIIYEMLDAMSSAGVYCSIFILVIEIIGPDVRGVCGVVVGAIYPIGTTVLGIAAWLVNDWRTYLRVLYMPGFLFIAYFWFLPESFRWYIARGQNEKAVENLRLIAKTNGKTLSDEVEDFLNKLEKNMISLKEDEQKVKNPLKEALSSKIIVLWILNCSYSWVTHTFVFYGLSLNSVGIAGNKYLNFILVSIIELPAYYIAWYALDTIGRRKTIFLALALSGISCTSFYFVESGSEIMKLTLFLCGKFGITVSFTGLYILASEIFPTDLRNSLMSLCSTIGRFGLMIAPQTPLLQPYIDPVLVFGFFSFVAAVLALYFPETLNKKLPDTLEEAEALKNKVKKNKLLENPKS